MIEKVKLRDFQAHHKLEVDFIPYVNTLVGPNESGKSSVLNALEWVCFNEGTPKVMQRHGADKVSVTLYYKGNKIIRSAGKGNYYKIHGDRLNLDRDRKVPARVSFVLNLSESTFQDQLDSPFWFSLTAGQLSREVNKIINLEVIDRTLQNADAKVRKLRSVVEVCTDRVDRARKDKRELSWIVDCETSLKALQTLQNRLGRVETASASLKALKAEYERIKARKDALVKRLTVVHHFLTTSGKLFSSLKEVSSKLNLLVTLKEQLTCLKSKLSKKQKSLELLRARLSTLTTCPACGQPLKARKKS